MGRPRLNLASAVEKMKKFHSPGEMKGKKGSPGKPHKGKSAKIEKKGSIGKKPAEKTIVEKGGPL